MPPAIGLRATAAHQHRPLAPAQALGLAEGFDGLLAIDDLECAGPVGASQAVLETRGAEHTRERVLDVQGDTPHSIGCKRRAPCEVQHLRQLAPGLSRRRRARLQEAEVVDDESDVGRSAPSPRPGTLACS
jgi:hypothetical protein